MKAPNRLLILILSLLLGQSSSWGAVLTFIIPSIPDYEKIPTYEQYQNFIRDCLADADIQVTFKPVPTMRHVDVVQKGEMDATILDNPHLRPRLGAILSTSFPILVLKYKIVHRKNDPTFDMQKLEQYRGAIVLSWYILKTEVNRRKLNYIETPSIQQNLKMLLAKRVDYVVAVSGVAKDALELIPSAKENLVVSNSLFLETPLYFSINVKHAKLLPKIEKAFRNHLRGNLEKYPLIKASLIHRND
jgi:hypothetical protein